MAARPASALPRSSCPRRSAPRCSRLPARLVRRERAFLYVPRFRRADLERELAKGEIARLLGFAPDRRAARPILSTFVDAIGEKDALLLDELEKLVRARRRKASARDGEPRAAR